MTLITEIPFIGGTLGVVLPFLAVLAIVVFVHEFGHYIAGRWSGIGAEVFSIGFGPRLLRWTDRRGTQWQVAAIPLGGYVKFTGDMDPASATASDEGLSEAERARAFHNAPLLARAAAVAAGPIANFLLAILLFSGIGMIHGVASDSPVIGAVPKGEEIGLEPGDRVLSLDGAPVETFSDIAAALTQSAGAPLSATVRRDGAERSVTVSYLIPPVIDAVSPGMPAARAGLVPGDRILTLDGEPVPSFHALQLRAMAKPEGAPLELTVERDGATRTFTLTPEMIERTNPVTGVREPLPTLGVSGLGLGGLQAARERLDPLSALLLGSAQTWRILSGTVTYVGDMIFAGADTGQLGGPIRIAQVSGEKAEEGFAEFIGLIAVLSASIGLINLFPIPILDGGHLMFYAVEAIRGRPLGERWMTAGNAIGLALVLLLMVFATYNDLLRL